MKKETPQYWFCKEGTEEFIVEGSRATAEECCRLRLTWSYVIKEAKVTVTVDSDGNETVNINK
tara:strand:+ start:722 stop:910 length:189 start_codon:yes stop_codon:yes gene_type:complete